VIGIGAGGVVEVPLTRTAWDEVVAADPDALVTQSAAWTGAVARVGRWRDVSRMFETRHGRVVVPMVRHRSTSGIVAIDASLPHAHGFGGIVAEGGTRADDLAAVLAVLASERRLRLAVRPNPLHEESWRLAASGWQRFPRRAHIVDLQGGNDQLWDRVNSSGRRGIRRSEREGVEVRWDATGADLPAFFDLMEESRTRWATDSNEPEWLARWRLREDSLHKWSVISSALGDRCRVYTARWKGELVAGTIVLFGPNAHYTRGAMRKELAGECRANYALHWQAIRDAAAAGFRSYSMGESGTSSSLARFKAQFGAATCDYHEYRRELVPISKVDHATRAVVKRVIGFREAT
jgi:hypothetical protein